MYLFTLSQAFCGMYAVQFCFITFALTQLLVILSVFKILIVHFSVMHILNCLAGLR